MVQDSTKPPPPPPDVEEVVRKCAEILGEHFDAVQILCSRQLPGLAGTMMVAKGSGNWYARQGMAQRFVHRNCAEEFVDVMRSHDTD